MGVLSTIQTTPSEHGGVVNHHANRCQGSLFTGMHKMQFHGVGTPGNLILYPVFIL